MSVTQKSVTAYSIGVFWWAGQLISQRSHQSSGLVVINDTGYSHTLSVLD
jgi:hypothetical protein